MADCWDLRERPVGRRWVRSGSRRGSVLLLSVLLLVGMVSLMAFAVDLGYLYTARAELQRSADAAALAATWQLYEDAARAVDGVTPAEAVAHARSEAMETAFRNPVARVAPVLGTADISVDFLAPVTSGGTEAMSNPASGYNSVLVRVQRKAGANGAVPLFFGRLLGVESLGMEATARALFWSNLRGFHAPASGGNLELLPIALDRDSWLSQIEAAAGADNYTWDPVNSVVLSGGDGIPEVNLYPQGTGSAGNRGTVDIGHGGNSTADLQRQVLHGINANDLALHGGSLELNAQGQLLLNGDTGISAAIKDELTQIRGQPRVIPLFDSVSGNGNNGNYTVVGFAGVRILNVRLTGPMRSKEVVIQPAPLMIRGGIPGGGPPTTRFVYSPVVLVE